VAGVITYYISTDYEGFILKFRQGGATSEACRDNLELSGTIPTFGQGPRETKKNLRRDRNLRRDSYTLSSTSVLDGVGGQRHASAALPPGKDPVPNLL
jgi:hypothetical protein